MFNLLFSPMQIFNFSKIGAAMLEHKATVYCFHRVLSGQFYSYITNLQGAILWQRLYATEQMPRIRTKRPDNPHKPPRMFSKCKSAEGLVSWFTIPQLEHEAVTDLKIHMPL